MDNANLSPTDVFSLQHHNELFLLQKEIDAPYNNLPCQESHTCEKLGQDDTSLILATNLSHTFVLPQFMAQHNCEELELTDTPSTVQTFIQASRDHTLNQIWAHNPMATQCNQSHYLTLLNTICAHNLSASWDNQANLSNSLASLCPPDSGEYVLKKSTADLGEQDFPVKWFKLIYPSSNPMIIETSTCSPFHVAYSPLASMNHQWTINLGDTPLPMP